MLIRHLWQLKTVIFLHRCLIHAVLLKLVQELILNLFQTAQWCDLIFVFLRALWSIASCREYWRGKYRYTVDLLFDWFGISCMTTDNLCFYLQNRIIQTSQTGGQQYSNTSPFNIPCFLCLPVLCWVQCCCGTPGLGRCRPPCTSPPPCEGCWDRRTLKQVPNRFETGLNPS